jgi:hypothetical protein
VFAYLVKPFKESDLVPALRAAVVRHAELLAARRAVGEKPLRPVVISVRSPSGNEWPLRVERNEDGELEVHAIDGGPGREGSGRRGRDADPPRPEGDARAGWVRGLR